MKNTKCKICRRLGIKLFLKGDKCLSQKCLMVKNPYPSTQGKRRKGTTSEYGKELKEKQKLKNWYNLRETQFKKYVKEVLDKRGKVEDAGDLLIKKLERRLDSVVFRLGFTMSRSNARQIVNHGHFLVNEKKVDIPSYQVKKGDIVSLRLSSREKTLFKNLSSVLKKYNPPSWLILDVEKLEGKVIGEPSLEEASPPSEISAIFEFYSR
ncbi:MAG: 30S ribosomal protein S4 [Candidatus Nealsonbacteria bacterium]